MTGVPAAAVWRETPRVADLVTHVEATGRDERLARMRAAVAQALAKTPDNADALVSQLYLDSRRRPRGASLLDDINKAGVASGLFREAVDPASAYWMTVVMKRLATDGGADPATAVACLILGHALGIESLGTAVDADVAVRFGGENAEVTIADRRALWRVSSTLVRHHFQYPFALEPGMWRWIAGFSADDVLLDVGANVGVYTIASSVLRDARVLALEPFAPNVEALRRNIRLNGVDDRVSVLPIAAAARDGEGLLSFGVEVPGVADQHFMADSDIGSPAANTVAVRGASIDSLIAGGEIPAPTRVKIDVDGGEDRVIAGMARTLASPGLRDVRLEVRWSRPPMRALVSHICRHGFRAFVDDDYKNLMFTRSDGPIEDEVVLPPERFR